MCWRRNYPQATGTRPLRASPAGNGTLIAVSESAAEWQCLPTKAWSPLSRKSRTPAFKRIFPEDFGERRNVISKELFEFLLYL